MKQEASVNVDSAQVNASPLVVPEGVSPLQSVRSRRSPFKQFLRSFFSNPNSAAGFILFAIILILVILAPLFTSQGPLTANSVDRFTSPNGQYWFGTDQLGRDLWSRVLYGGRLSIGAGLIAVSVSLAGGVVVGLLAGYYGRWVDMILMRLVDVLMAMPGILLTMIFIFTLGPTLVNAMIAIGLASIPDYARVVRGSVLSARELQYVEAAEVVGVTPAKIMARHILPNIVAPVLVLATIGIGGAILSLAGLSFLGLGAQPPTPEWGVLVSDGRGRIGSAWWVSTLPGLAIAITVVAINLIGDGLRDILDPRMKTR